jgi:hypothetical protein
MITDALTANAGTKDKEEKISEISCSLDNKDDCLACGS